MPIAGTIIISSALGLDNSNLISTEKAVPIIPAKIANIKYRVAISLALVEFIQFMLSTYLFHGLDLDYCLFFWLCLSSNTYILLILTADFRSIWNHICKNSATLAMLMHDVTMSALWQHIAQVHQQAKLTYSALAFGVPLSHYMFIEWYVILSHLKAFAQMFHCKYINDQL